jgi:bifunctional DNA-binding transcriptional regulator/antitoxin component of YhaV-PrlF toxin-antitoxin module
LVKLQKRFAYKYKEKDHYKYIVTIPSDTMEQLDWKPEIDLSVTVSNESIVIKPTNDDLVDKPRTRRRGGGH